VLARVVLLVEPVVLLVVPVLLELPVLLAVRAQVPVAVHRPAPQPANRDRADKAASPTRMWTCDAVYGSTTPQSRARFTSSGC
jgi:hypothetical protein